tara:strand:- start:668 stop:862 length:195 start_codon:yes stop_codon:yes gene_type:complete
MAYKNLDLNNDDVVLFMEWYKVQLDEVELVPLHNIADIMIDIVRRPHKYDDKYQEFRQEEYISE